MFVGFAMAAQGKFLVFSLSAPLQELCLFHRVPNSTEPWRDGSSSAPPAARFCVLGPVLMQEGFLLCSFSRKELRAISLFLGKGQGVSLQSAAVTRAGQDGKEDNDTSVLLVT